MEEYLKGSEWNSGAQWNRTVIPAGMSKASTTRGLVPSPPPSCLQDLKPLECCVEPPQHADSTFSSWKGKTCLKTEERSELGDTPMLRFRRESEVGNLDLDRCLFSSPNSLDLFCAPQNVDQANQSLLQTPLPAFHSPIWEGISPVFRSPSTQDNQQQQQYSQLTIFYAGTVNVYDVSPDLAEAIMVLANRESSSTSSFTYPIPSTTFPAKMSSMDQTDQSHPSITPKAANFPFARQNSLQRFLEKRNDRSHAEAAAQSHLHHN